MSMLYVHALLGPTAACARSALALGPVCYICPAMRAPYARSSSEPRPVTWPTSVLLARRPPRWLPPGQALTPCSRRSAVPGSTWTAPPPPLTRRETGAPAARKASHNWHATESKKMEESLAAIQRKLPALPPQRLYMVSGRQRKTKLERRSREAQPVRKDPKTRRPIREHKRARRSRLSQSKAE